MTKRKQPIDLEHMAIGPCQLVRTEGVIWVIRQVSTNAEYRIPPGRRSEFRKVEPRVEFAERTAKQVSKDTVLPGSPHSASEREVQNMVQNLAVKSPLSRVNGQSSPSTPDEVAETSPSLWSELEEWIQHDANFENRHVVLCRRVFVSCLTGGRLTSMEAKRAGRLLAYALTRGFRSQRDSPTERTHTSTAPFDAESASRVQAATWSALSDWVNKVDLFKPEVRQFSSTFARLKQRGAKIPIEHYATAARILNRSLQLGFSRERACLEEGVLSPAATDQQHVDVVLMCHSGDRSHESQAARHAGCISRSR